MKPKILLLGLLCTSCGSHDKDTMRDTTAKETITVVFQEDQAIRQAFADELGRLNAEEERRVSQAINKYHPRCANAGEVHEFVEKHKDERSTK